MAIKPGKHPNSLKNLKPTKPGDKLNPHGRPKGVKNWQTVYMEVFNFWEKLTPEKRIKFFSPIVGKNGVEKIKSIDNLQVGIAFRTICAALMLNDTHARRDIEEILDGTRIQKVQTDVTQKQVVEIKNKPEEKTLNEALQVLSNVGVISNEKKSTENAQ